MIRALAMIALLGACSFERKPFDPAADAALDVPRDTLPPNCFGTGLDVQVCLTALPAAGDKIHVDSNRAVNTNAGSSDCAPEISAFCVMAASGVRIDQGNTLRASGTRPLVMISTAEVVIEGILDVASGLIPLRVGPGADSSRCHDGTAATDSGGGWGGSLGTKGGNGGPVGGAVAGATLVPTTLQGGCKGSDGASQGGQAGHGGGAVYLIAASMISVSGSINASGGSGTGAAGGGRGGGGGGSGGMIVFDTPSLTVVPGAQIFANGGGGGEGSGGNMGADGIDPSAPGAGGIGGVSSTTGGNGGGGGFGTATGSPGDPPGAGADGTGGGGGGAGVIKVFRAVPSGTVQISPPFS